MTRIMFVDDEAMVLSGLRRSLRRSAPRDWELTFALGGREALDQLEQQKFDVVVSDARMPEVNGAAVLEAVKAKSPDTVRIVLSGQMEEANAMRLLELAHQFLAKPCPPETIVEEISTLLGVQHELIPAHVRELLGTIDGLPPVPRVYAQLESVMRGVETSAKDIAEVVQTDGSLTARILRMVNSSFFALRREIVDIEAAVAHLGSDLVRSVVLQVEAAAMQDGLADEVREAREKHGGQVLALARRNAPSGLTSAVAAAGVLLDVGEIVLSMVDDAKWDEYVERRTPVPSERLELERELFGATHDEIGAALLAMWGVPDQLVSAVRYHHNPSGAPGDKLVAFLHAVDHVVWAAEAGTEPDYDRQAVAAAEVEENVAKAIDAFANA